MLVGSGLVLDASGLARLMRSRNLPRDIRLDQTLPLRVGDRLVWQDALNRHLRNCGCAEGTVGLFLGIALSIFYAIPFHFPTNDHMMRCFCAPNASSSPRRTWQSFRFRKMRKHPAALAELRTCFHLPERTWISIHHLKRLMSRKLTYISEDVHCLCYAWRSWTT